MKYLIPLLAIVLMGCEKNQVLPEHKKTTEKQTGVIEGTWIVRSPDIDFVYKFKVDSFQRSLLTDKYYYSDYSGLYHFNEDTFIMEYKHILWGDGKRDVDFTERYTIIEFMPDLMRLEFNGYIRIFRKI